MFHGENLTLARQRRSMNKSKFAAAAGMTVQTLSNYERGDSVPNETAIERIASVLDMPVPFFFDESIASAVGLAGASFRAMTRMTAAQRDAAVASGAFCVQFNRWLGGEFDLPAMNLPEIEYGLLDPDTAATFVRTHWGIGLQPIQNLLQLAEANGVRVFALPTACREVDAFSFWHDGVPYVCLGTHKTPERAVFDLAHEVGHLVLHRGHAAPRGREAEHEADQFASSFLMPAEDVRAHAPRRPQLRDLTRAKVRWRVSVAALNYRMHSLGMTSDWHYREMCIEIARLGRDREPNSLPRDQSKVLNDALNMLRSEGVHRQHIAAALNISATDLNQMVDGLVVSAVDGTGDQVSAGPRNRDHLRVV